MPAFSDLLSEAFSDFKAQYRTFLRFNLLFVSFFLMANYISALAALEISYEREIQTMIYTVLTLVFSAYINGGLFYFYLSYLRGISITTNQLFRGYRWYISTVIYYLVGYGFYEVFFSDLGLLPEYGWRVQTAIVIGLLLSLFMLVRLIFILPLMIDHRISLIRALKISFRMTYGRFFRTFVFILTVFSVLIAGIAVAGAGVLVSLSLFSLIFLRYYSALYEKFSTFSETERGVQ